MAEEKGRFRTWDCSGLLNMKLFILEQRFLGKAQLKCKGEPSPNPKGVVCVCCCLQMFILVIRLVYQNIPTGVKMATNSK